MNLSCIMVNSFRPDHLDLYRDELAAGTPE
jgi:hypothetical protein